MRSAAANALFLQALGQKHVAITRLLTKTQQVFNEVVEMGLQCMGLYYTESSRGQNILVSSVLKGCVCPNLK